MIDHESYRAIAARLPEGQAAMYLLGLKYLEALPLVTQGKGTTIFLPSEATGVMGALGGMRELLMRQSGAANQPDEAAPRRLPGPSSGDKGK